MKVRLIFQILVVVLLQSCAGYHFNTNNNPLIGYDIKSIAVPMFINRTNIVDLAAPVTKEVIMALNDYSGLRVYNGNDDKADAILIGVLESKDYYSDVMRTTQRLFTDDTVQSSVGARTPFYYPVQTTYDFQMKVYLIKRPTKDELSLVTTNVSEFLKYSPKVVLMDVIELTNNFYRVVAETSQPTSPGKTNFVKNKGIMEKSIADTAQKAAKSFKQVVLNAF